LWPPSLSISALPSRFSEFWVNNASKQQYTHTEASPGLGDCSDLLAHPSSQGQPTIRELVCRLVLRVPIVPTHPLQRDLAGQILPVQQLPEFLVQYRRSRCRFSAFFDPAGKPFTQTFQGVLTIRAQDHFRPFGYPAQGLDGRRQFGNVVGALFLDKTAMLRAFPIRRLDHRPQAQGPGLVGPQDPSHQILHTPTKNSFADEIRCPEYNAVGHGVPSSGSPSSCRKAL